MRVKVLENVPVVVTTTDEFPIDIEAKLECKAFEEVEREFKEWKQGQREKAEKALMTKKEDRKENTKEEKKETARY
jgi:hypothetical protein